VADAGRPDTNRRGLVVAVVALAIAALLSVGILLGTRLATPSVPVASGPTAVAASESPTPTVADIYDRVVMSMVVVTADRDRLGSGVVATRDGEILTAAHVVSGADTIQVAFADGTKTTATVASSDEASDIASLIPADLPETIVPATLGGAVEVGGPVVAIGNPLGLAASASAGVVSGLDRRADTADGKFAGLIQFDAAVNPGSSGGPLLNASGHVVGIVVSIADPGKDRAFAGIGFAVPIGTALGGDGPGPQI
jgi:putative serine protease PepD